MLKCPSVIVFIVTLVDNTRVLFDTSRLGLLEWWTSEVQSKNQRENIVQKCAIKKLCQLLAIVITAFTFTYISNVIIKEYL